MDFLEIAKEIEFNAEAEAKAVLDYTELLNSVARAGMTDEDKKEIIDAISEIISDELNHQEKLRTLYTALTGIEANKN